LSNDDRAEATARRNIPRVALLGVAAAAVVAAVAVALITAGPSPAPREYRPGYVDLVASVEQAGAAWEVQLESGRRVTVDASVRDVLRPVSPPLSPSVGDLMLADALPPAWVAFSLGGGGPPGDECYEIHQPAVVRGDRLVFTSGLSLPIGVWRRGPVPSPGASFGGACLDREGNAVDEVLAPALRSLDRPAIAVRSFVDPAHGAHLD
jgi:hypothetical protein